MKQLDLIVSYGILQATTAEYTFFSSSHGTFTKTDHILGHKMYLNRLEKKKEKSYKICSDHTGINLEINHRKIVGKPPNTWRLNNTLLNNT